MTEIVKVYSRVYACHGAFLLMDQRRTERRKKKDLSNNPIKNIDGASLNIDERLDFLLDYKTNFLDGCNPHCYIKLGSCMFQHKKRIDFGVSTRFIHETKKSQARWY